MITHGIGYLNAETANEGYFFKAIANLNEVTFFTKSIQHRDMKISGLSYEDDYKGNALACIIRPNQIEVRYHKQYRDEDVERLFRSLLLMPELAVISKFSVSYQGRSLI